MEYRVLTIGLSDEIFSGIQAALTSSNLRLTSLLTVRDAGHMLDKQMIHLLIANLEYLRSIGQDDWLAGIRRITFIPVVILSDNPEQDTSPMVQLGADICVHAKGSCHTIANLIFAQLRRSTEYNPQYTPGDAENVAFHMGDFFIDPARRTVEVCNQPVSLRPREFALLLYFMRNQNIVLTPKQICEHAWGLDYTQSVFQSIHDLRKQIEPNIRQSCYIKTIHRVGYQFMSHHSETCDN
ncbi:MAG: response regulator transcription factor [Oscillibacter sp.]|nr:response regulator transcription factor [Oscillibacter sp.]